MVMGMRMWLTWALAAAESCSTGNCEDATGLLTVRMGVSKNKEHADPPNPDCPERSKEYAIQLCVDEFANRDVGIQQFRAKLEAAEQHFSWFQHKKDVGTEYTQIANYLNLAPGNEGNTDLMDKHHLQFRYRRQLDGKKMNKTDFVVKFKTGKVRNPINKLAPMTPSSTWKDAWSCKVEDNVKYLPCPNAECFPQETCYSQCSNLNGMPGLGLESQEHSPKIKGNPGDPFAVKYTSASAFQTLADVTALLPDIATAFQLPPGTTPLKPTVPQWRYTYDDVSWRSMKTRWTAPSPCGTHRKRI